MEKYGINMKFNTISDYIYDYNIISWLIVPIFAFIEKYIINKYVRLLLFIPSFIVSLIWFIPGLILTMIVFIIAEILDWAGFTIEKK